MALQPRGANTLICRCAYRLLQRSWSKLRIYPGPVLELSSLDLEQIAEALADHTPVWRGGCGVTLASRSG